MGCGRSCVRYLGYEPLDQDDTQRLTSAKSGSQKITDLGVPTESEVLEAIDDVDKDVMDLSDVELEIYISRLQNK
jgi:hypothetical protein